MATGAATDRNRRADSTPDLSPRLLTAALQLAAPGCEVRSAVATEVGAGRGFVGTTLRLALDYEPGPSGPSTIIAKLPPVNPLPDEDLAALIRSLGATEVAFYQHMAHRAGVRVPACWYVTAEPEAVLLMEDLGHLHAASQLDGLTAAQAHTAVDHLARLHARWWAQAELRTADWVRQPEADAALWARRFAEGWPDLEARLGRHGLPASFAAVGHRLGPRLASLVLACAEPGWTLIHGDFRAENLFFGATGTPEELCVIDWQLAGRGGGARDLGYLLAHSLPVAVRRAEERALLDRYRAGLQAGGVNYPAARLWDDYRRAVLVSMWLPAHFLGLTRRLIASGAGATLSEQARAAVLRDTRAAIRLVTAAAERNIAAIEDTGAAELLA
ncbi:MAG: oxidoreductase family protein [Dehalococcoidia bacterium]